MVDLGLLGRQRLLAREIPHKPGEVGALSGTELPSFCEACALLSGRHSCLVLDTRRRHIALPPRYLRSKRSGIRGQLNTELLRYSEGLNGVPVAYDDVKIVGELGDIFDDQGHIHLNIEAEFVVFRPKAGEKLVGVVNKVAPSHIGCLVHGCFNASIPKPPKMPAEDWQNLGVKIGDQLEFEVFRLDSDAVGVFCIRGKLDAESIKVISSQAPPDGPADTSGDMDYEAGPLMDKKKSFLNEENVDNRTEDIGNISGVPLLGYTDGAMENVLFEEKAKKKRKEHKQHDVIQERDSSDYVGEPKKDKKKKRKLPEDYEISETSEEPKSKKKKINT